MTNTWVLTPCHQPRLDDLKASLAHLNHPLDRTVVVTTLPDPIDPDELPGVSVLLSPEPGINISRWWNVGLDWIEQNHVLGPYEVLCMASDVRIDWSVLTRLRSVLCSYNLAMVGPDWHGVATGQVETRYDLEAWPMEHRIPGACMLVAGEVALRFDEQFRWQYANDDFEWQHRKAGGTGLVRGLMIAHSHSEPLTSERAEYAEVDRQRFIAKWGGPPIL
ncbi:MAG: glycosyltransferase family 2 protein [Pseudonocardiaceae bacterium]